MFTAFLWGRRMQWRLGPQSADPFGHAVTNAERNTSLNHRRCCAGRWSLLSLSFRTHCFENDTCLWVFLRGFL